MSMLRSSLRTLLASICVPALAACAMQAKPSASSHAASATAPPALPGADITAASIRARIEALSSDAMAGRATGSPESLKAAAMLADVLRADGLQPAGDGGFLQTIDWAGFAFDGPPELSWTGADGATQHAAWGTEFDVASGPPVSRTLKVLVLTPGKDAPQPARGDAALMLVGPRRAAQQWLRDAGAEDGAGWGALLSPSQTEGAAPGAGARSLYRKADKDAPLVPLRIIVRGKLRDALQSGAVTQLTATVHARDEAAAVNVIGRLDGVGTPAHPELAQQVVVFSAHYDHLGVKPAPPAPPAPANGTASDAHAAAPASPDLIFNGADDDASGCSAVLALADAFGAQVRAGNKPARTLVFLLVTGEERGLLGTEYYLDHPVAPLDCTVMDLNFEMIGRADPLVGGAGHLWLTGFELSNLGPAWAAAGLPIAADQRPEQHFFERSDNYAFVERHVVGQTLSSYNLHTDYHTVADEADRLDYAHLVAAVRAGLAAAQTLADGSLMPQWTKSPDAPAATAPAASQPTPGAADGKRAAPPK